MATSNVQIEFSIKEAMIICEALASYLPKKEEEMITFMVYSRIKARVQKRIQKDESS